ncbi:MAG: sigma-70 family RNA polymerase sigma factor, partial [Candidatus Cryptobacteroides sp.]
MLTESPSAVQLFELLFTRQRQVYVNLARSIVRDDCIAEDIVSDTFSYVWENREKLKVDDYVDYLFIAVKTNCLDYRRSTARHQEIHDRIARREQGLMEYYSRAIESCNPSGVYEREILEIVMKELDKMPRETREVFIKKKFEGKSYKDISDETGMTASQIDNRLRCTNPCRGASARAADCLM